MMDNFKTKSCRPPKLQKSNAYQPVSNTLAGQTLIYMQMSNHYRRVENAKSVVDSGLHSNGQKFRPCNYCDTGTSKNYNSSNPSEYNSSRLSNPYSPTSNRTNLNNSGMHSPSPSDMDLVDQIVFDSKHKPNAFYKDASGLVHAPTSHTHCAKPRDVKNKKIIKPRPIARSRSPEKSLKTKFQKPSVPMDIIDHHPEQFVPCKSFQPRILKSTAQSRVQDLTVYHAPRKRPLPQQENNPQQDLWLTDSQVRFLDQVNYTEGQNVHDEYPWNFEEPEMKHDKGDERPGSKGSSRSNGDSAYCGGVSSGGCSRGSTPERYSSTKKKPAQKLHRRFHEETYSSADSQDFPMSAESTRNRDPVFADTGFPGIGNKEEAYATFLRSITEDILERGIFTDKGINSIFRRYIEENKYDLDQDRMRLEVSNLRKLLGIVDDAANTNFPDGMTSSYNRGTNEIQCRAGCNSQYINNTQPNKSTKSPAIEDIISEMEQCVKIDVRAVKSTCSCPGYGKINELGCGCDKTCTEANEFEKFFETGFGNRTPASEQGNKIKSCAVEPDKSNYCKASKSTCSCPGDGKNNELGCGCDKTCTEANEFEKFFETGFGNRTPASEQGNKIKSCAVEPDKSNYCKASNSSRSSDGTDQFTQVPPDRHQAAAVSYFDTNDDSRKKSYSRGSKGSRLASEAASNMQSSSDDYEEYYGDRDIDGGDSCGTAHVDSLCSRIKTESTDDFFLEKLVMNDLMDSDSHFDHPIMESETLNITNNYQDGIQNGNLSDQSEEFPMERSDLSSARDSSNGNETDSETEVGIEEPMHDSYSEGRTVYFNKAPERESSMETFQDSKGNELNRVVQGQTSSNNLVDAPLVSSKALVTFASDKNTQSDSADHPVNPENPKNIGNENRLRSEHPSTEKKGCFGLCGKKKKVSELPDPPLKSALKARE